MKLKVLKYDKIKARWLLALLKFGELFAVFLLVFGFHGLGSLVYNNFPELFRFFGLEVANFGNLWLCGFYVFFFGICALLVIYEIIWIIYSIFKAWFKANWRWAKVLSEDKKSKQERLKEKEKLKLIKKIEKMDEDRKKFGYCVGDEIVFKNVEDYPKDCHAPNGAYGEKATIKSINSEGKFLVEEFNETGLCAKKEIARVIKIPIPKKPKLSPMRQKEVEGWKK